MGFHVLNTPHPVSKIYALSRARAPAHRFGSWTPIYEDVELDENAAGSMYGSGFMSMSESGSGSGSRAETKSKLNAPKHL